MANHTAADIKGTAREDRRRYARRQEGSGRANGDQQKAAEIIRVKGLKGITKREGRATAEEPGGCTR